MVYLPSNKRHIPIDETAQPTPENQKKKQTQEEIDLLFENEVFATTPTSAGSDENVEILADTQPVKIKHDEPPPLQSITHPYSYQEQKGSLVDQTNTRPHVLNISASLDELRSSSPVMYFINYACVMIPRLPHHQLSGELALRLPDWIGQVCLAFGWRLEHLSIHSGHIQWVVNASPTNSPNYIVRTIRQLTSQRIFAEFPTLGNENPSRDFWAPGYLIISGSQPPTMQLIRDFIIKVREHQGAAIGF
jgi:REP element-mobilizing transposase RayT